ncbi:MAG: 2-oxoacid:acceptor oxidoreductase family protein [Candidatus Peregrinibacteria bacterium]|nr:2-oxoacid:acceptor oxidoreductase family protein [Candidatus Peregrinibacteria bacterium]
MKDTFTVEWHSRAGQGAITAANFLAEACANLGFHVQSFPNFGAEKRGAPVVVFNRISKEDKILDDPAHITNIDISVLVDTSLLGDEISYNEITAKNKTGILLINTSQKEPSKFKENFNGKIYHVPASQIAMETINRDIPNVAIIGGLTKILALDFDKIKKELIKNLTKAFPQKIVDKNMIGYERGYKEIRKI